MKSDPAIMYNMYATSCWMNEMADKRAVDDLDGAHERLKYDHTIGNAHMTSCIMNTEARGT
eukprot:scaffold284866_cov42-Prasinocladus_malaysianus.AAC.1